MINFLKKYAEQESIKISFVTGWIDDYGNIMVVATIGGKKYCFVGSDSTNQNSWNYCFGIGTTENSVSDKTPAGVGQYLVGKSLEKGYADVIALAVNENKGKLRAIHNKSGASWSPANESQKNALQDLVKTYEQINSELSSMGILYSEGDRKIYGKDIMAHDIASWVAPKAAVPATQTQNTQTTAPTQQVSGDTPNVIAFIPFLKEEFRRVFGRDLNKFSTFRSAIQQAYAMRFPIRDGTYDQLYGKVPEAAQIKDLINSERYEEAANIISTTRLAKGSHMAGKAIDVPFGPNGLNSSNHTIFKNMIASASKRSGISANINFENVSHFHINVN